MVVASCMHCKHQRSYDSNENRKLRQQLGSVRQQLNQRIEEITSLKKKQTNEVQRMKSAHERAIRRKELEFVADDGLIARKDGIIKRQDKDIRHLNARQFRLRMLPLTENVN